MAAKKRTTAQREQGLEILASLYLRRMRQTDIAKELGVTQQQISHDLRELQARWRESALVNFNEAMGNEIARVDELERAYWEAWENSKTEVTTSRSKRKEFSEDVPRVIPAAGGKPAAAIIDKVTTVQSESSLERAQRLGDPRYLEGVQWCITARAKIFDRLNLDSATDERKRLPGPTDTEEGAWRVLTVVKDYGPPEGGGDEGGDDE